MADKIFDAIEFANRIHRGQYRKGLKIPKLVHLIRVMNTLYEYHCCEEVVIAGVLHDSLEDTQTSYDDLVNKFGQKVGDLVKGASEQDKSLSWEERKKLTIDYLKTAPDDVLAIVCADKLDNLRSTRQDLQREGDEIWEKFNRGKDQQQWYFKSIIEVLKVKLINSPTEKMLRELEDEYTEVFIH
jgi:(p)ppGpp synthase/HD superfamily hydrolase